MRFSDIKSILTAIPAMPVWLYSCRYYSQSLRNCDSNFLSTSLLHRNLIAIKIGKARNKMSAQMFRIYCFLQCCP